MKKNKHDVFYYCDKAEKSNLKVDFNSFGHPIIESKDGKNSLMLPNNLQSASMEGKIRNWLVKLGVMLILIITLAYLL